MLFSVLNCTSGIPDENSVKAQLLSLQILSSLAFKRGLGCCESPGGLEVERAKDLWDEVLQLTFTNMVAVGFHFLSVVFSSKQKKKKTTFS